jgi:phage terminase large subunit GpA-like protein
MYPSVHSYVVRFRAYSSMPIAKLKRKHARQSNIHKSRPSEVFNRRITSIERVKSVPVRCIQVDSPSQSSVIVMQPSLDMGMAWSKDRLAPMVRDTPCLRDKIRTGQTKDGSSTMLHKKFSGGHLTVVGANSAASMASRPIKVVLCDEVDRYPASAGDEGDPVTLVKVRSTTFWDRKFFACSTPF